MMKSMGRAARHRAYLAMAAASLSMAACGGDGDDARSVTLGYSPISLGIPALERNARELRRIGAEKGFQLLVGDPRGDPTTQVQQLMGWIRRRQVSGIWTIPASATSLASVLRTAQTERVPVVAIGVPQDFGFDGPTR